MMTTFDLPTEQLEAIPASFRLRHYLTNYPQASSHEVIKALAMAAQKLNERMVEFVRQFLPPDDSESTTTVVVY